MQNLPSSFSISGPDERCRLMRRTIVRYLNLGLVLTLRLTCLPVKKRFPTLDHLVEAGILEEKEKEVSCIPGTDLKGKILLTNLYHTKSLPLGLKVCAFNKPNQPR